MNISECISRITLLFPNSKNQFKIKNTVQYNENNELTSDTKEQYMKDFDKVNKKKNNRKKKNKQR